MKSRLQVAAIAWLIVGASLTALAQQKSGSHE
jgi:hypothetical protein